MGNDGGSSRVSIPSNVQKTINGIKEIVGQQHTDGEIYTILKECFMDPDESTHKLLDLDSFHEVRRKQDKKKDGFNSRASKDSRSKQVGQGRKGKGGSVGYSSEGYERGHESSARPVSHKKKADSKSEATRVSAVALSGSGLSASKSSSPVTNGSNAEDFKPQAVDAAASSPVKIVGLVTSIDKGKSLQSSDQLLAFTSSAPVSGVFSSSLDPLLAPSIIQSLGADGVIDSKVGSQDISVVDLPSPKNEESDEVEKNHLPEVSLLSSSLSGSLKSSSSCGSQPPPETANASEASEASVQSSAEWGQHVIFPDHFKVPEALKLGLTFGSFRNFSPIEISGGATGGDNNNSASLESSPGNDETVTDGNESVPSHEMFLLPYYGNARFQSMCSPSQTPTLQSSIPVSPQYISLYIPPYHSNFIPYGHYYPLIYVLPMHQYMGHNGFSQLLSGGNMYLPPPDAGIRFPFTQIRAVVDTGDASQFGIPSGLFYIQPVGYGLIPIGNPGNPTGNEVLAASQMNENHIYTTEQLGEDPSMWIPALGQDLSSLQINPMYNLFPQGHLTFPPVQTSHDAFAGIYQAPETVASPSTLLQQSPEAVAGPVEDEGSPIVAYQQPEQNAQTNWNSDL